VKSEEFLPA